MSNIDKISAQTIVNLSKNGISPTPNEYHKEFCKIAQVYSLDVKECEQFKLLVSKLNAAEQKEIEEKNIETIEDMIPILLNRVATKNLDSLSDLLSSSLTPSINFELDENLAKFSIKIGNSPALIFEEDIQKEIKELIEKRFVADKTIVNQKTKDLAKLISLMGQYLNDAIANNTTGSINVKKIKDNLVSINVNKNDLHQELIDFQNKLIVAAKSIENEMKEVNLKLTNGKDKVAILQSRIKELEKQLENSKRESLIDHLTGALTRRAFEKEIKKSESLYNRKKEVYSLIFFDIDHFKKINDTYGHEGGDVVLKTFAKVLQKQTRDEDVIARFGGEEFVAIIHYNDDNELLNYVKRIKKIITDNSFIYKEHKIKVTFSAGVVKRENYKDFDDALNNADSLLYEAKNTGRNKIIFDDNTNI